MSPAPGDEMLRVALNLLLSVLLLPGLAAQAPASGDGDRSIRLNVVVTQGNDGKPLAGLPQSQFSILDNGVPQQLKSFRQLSGAQEPVRLMLVVDAVNLDYTRLAYERGQVKSFLRSQDGHLAVPTSLAIVTDSGTQIQPEFSTDGNALSDSLEKQVIGLRTLRRSSGFYGAEERLQISLKSMEGLLSRAQALPGRKLIVWISPGWPLLSGPGVQLTSHEENGIFEEVVRLSNQARLSNATIYSVDPIGAGESPGRAFYYEAFLKGVRKPSDVLPGNLGLQVLAVQSGGLALAGSNEIGHLLQRCMDDGQAYYELTYTPPPSEAPRQFHRVEVRTTERLTVRTLHGYYSQP